MEDMVCTAGPHDVSTTVRVAICTAYICFAAQMAWQSGRAMFTVAGRAVFFIVGVFLFCMYSGYGSTLPIIPDWWYAYREPAHWLLAFFSWGLVATNQAGIVARMLRADMVGHVR